MGTRSAATGARWEATAGTGVADVVLYCNRITMIAANEPMPAFGDNSNGRIDFATIVWLFNRL